MHNILIYIYLEDHNQDCSSDDLLQIFSDHNLDLSTVSNLTSTQLFLLSRSIRCVEFEFLHNMSYPEGPSQSSV